MTDAAGRVQRARSLTSVDEARVFYDEWAAHYDADIYGSLTFTGTDRLVALTVQLVEPTATVLDAGCGTGAVGTRVQPYGFTTIDGIDLSDGMLAIAATTDCYRKLIGADLNRPLPISADVYDAVVSAGTFVTGHVRADALVELARITRTGGVVVFTVLASFWEPGGFAEVVPTLVTEGVVAVLHDQTVSVTADGKSEARLVAMQIGQASSPRPR
jgi:predicted TPR repeat methyltransferase